MGLILIVLISGILYHQGYVSIQRCRLTSIGIPISEIRWSRDMLIFNMGIPQLERRSLTHTERCCLYLQFLQIPRTTDDLHSVSNQRPAHCSTYAHWRPRHQRYTSCPTYHVHNNWFSLHYAPSRTDSRCYLCFKKKSPQIPQDPDAPLPCLATLLRVLSQVNISPKESGPIYIICAPGILAFSGPFDWHELSLIKTWISTHMPSTMSDLSLSGSVKGASGQWHMIRPIEQAAYRICARSLQK